MSARPLPEDRPSASELAQGRKTPVCPNCGRDVFKVHKTAVCGDGYKFTYEYCIACNAKFKMKEEFTKRIIRPVVQRDDSSSGIEPLKLLRETG